MIMQARAMRDCSHIAECSLSYTMTVQARAYKSLLLFARVQSVICKDNIKYFILLLP